jgi:MFS family permease
VPKKSKTIGLHLDARTMTQIFIVLLIATACGGVIFNSTTVAMPKIFDERLRALTQTNVGIGALVAVVYSVAAFAQVLMGTLMSRYEMKPLMIGVGIAQVPLLFAAATLDGWPMLVVALLMMMAIFGQIPLNDAIVGKYVADEYRARVLSVRYVVSLGVAALAVPMIALLHRTEGGFRNVFMVLGVLALAIFAAALFFPSRQRMQSAQAAAA